MAKSASSVGEYPYSGGSIAALGGTTARPGMRLQGGRVEIVGAQARRPREDRRVGIAHRPAPVRARVIASEAVGRPARRDHAVHTIAGRDHDGMRARLADDASPVVLLIRERQRPCPRRLDHLDARIGGKRRRARATASVAVPSLPSGNSSTVASVLARRLARPAVSSASVCTRAIPRCAEAPPTATRRRSASAWRGTAARNSTDRKMNDAASQRHHDLPS